jgi:hypothetical protein
MTLLAQSLLLSIIPKALLPSMGQSLTLASNPTAGAAPFVFKGVGLDSTSTEPSTTTSVSSRPKARVFRGLQRRDPGLTQALPLSMEQSLHSTCSRRRLRRAPLVAQPLLAVRLRITRATNSIAFQGAS